MLIAITTIIGLLIAVIITGAIIVAVIFHIELGNILAFRKLHGQEFNCKQCGKCCGFTVVVGEFDKKQLEESGKKLTECVTKKLGVSYLKKVGNACCFLETSECLEKKACNIYEDRLYICRRFPFLTYAGFKAIDKRCPEVQLMLKAKQTRNT